MSITAGQVAEKLRLALHAASSINPTVALASAGVDALTGLFSATREVKTVMDQVYTETAETAPEVAQIVSVFYTDESDALKKSFKDRPGT